LLHQKKGRLMLKCQKLETQKRGEDLKNHTPDIQKNILKLSTKISFNCLENKSSTRIPLQVERTSHMIKNNLQSFKRKEIFLKQKLKFKFNLCAKNMHKLKLTNYLKTIQNWLSVRKDELHNITNVSKHHKNYHLQIYH